MTAEEKKARRLQSMMVPGGTEPAPPEDDDDPAPSESLDEEAAPAGAPPQDERRLRLLAGVPADVAALITDAELDEIEAEERAAAAAERKEKALAAVRKGARQRARVDNDLVSARAAMAAEDRRRLVKRVDFRFELPEGGDAIDGFRIDGHIFQNRIWHRDYPMAVVESLRSNFYRAHLSEVQFSALNQNKKGRSAGEVMNRNPPVFEVRDAA